LKQKLIVVALALICISLIGLAIGWQLATAVGRPLIWNIPQISAGAISWDLPWDLSGPQVRWIAWTSDIPRFWERGAQAQQDDSQPGLVAQAGATPTRATMAVVAQPTLTVPTPTSAGSSPASPSTATPPRPPHMDNAAPDLRTAAAQKVLAASRLTIHADAPQLAAAVAADPYTIGVIDYATYDDNAGQLRLVTLPFSIGSGAVVVVVSQHNTFVDTLTLGELQLAFSRAQLWSEIKPDWPFEPIQRVLPEAQTVHFAIFAETIFGGSALRLAARPITPPSDNATPVMPVDAAAQIQQSELTASADEVSTADAAGVADASTEADADADVQADPAPSSAPPATTAADTRPDAELDAEHPAPGPVSIGWMRGHTECALMADVMALVLEQIYGRRVYVAQLADAEEMFQRLAGDAADTVESIDLTPCFRDPEDRAFLREKGSKITLLADAYGRTAEHKLYLAAHSGLPPTLRYADRCVYEFLRNFHVGEMASASALDQQNAATWLADNTDRVVTWTACSLDQSPAD